MATVTEIIDYAELMYPRVIDISDSNKLIIINQLLKEIDNRLMRVRWENDPYEAYSVANQASYSLPSNCNPKDILKIMVSQVDSDEITSSTEYDIFDYVALNDKTNVDFGNFYMLQDGLLYLFKDGFPLATSDLSIRIFYYRDTAKLTLVTETPDIEEDYHNLFKYGLIQNVASIGDNPEALIADYWQKKFDEELNVALMDLTDRFDTNPIKSKQIDERW